eukprot:9500015-Pyramimonas_sp.AAC.1
MQPNAKQCNTTERNAKHCRATRRRAATTWSDCHWGWAVTRRRRRRRAGWTITTAPFPSKSSKP